ncbi:unnamed protein product [Cylicocyclus nassatus]|uniref:Uncharacterized protein n=1 Tax=Cylicocyclus nassatus TaxID=53992 RepID=A0AA36GL00_CYLNA|nr:unnamed protein product [Cylicocyclus nassatus]
MNIDTFLDYFASHHIHMKAEWLQVAIDFVSSREPEKTKNMHVLLFEQFIHSNLADSYLPLAKVPVVAVRAVILKQMIFQSKNHFWELKYLLLNVFVSQISDAASEKSVVACFFSGFAWWC